MPISQITSQEQRLTSFDTFYITYDEPATERKWEKIKQTLPHAARVDGVKGFDKAHKTCACLTSQKRFTTIDGDNSIIQDLFTHESIPSHLIDSNYTLSWSATNSINGLCYGNGGVKSWPTHIVNNMNTHENSESEDYAVDFCFKLNYYQMPSILSVSSIHHTPYQAFRSGFREGVKFGLINGEKINSEDFNNIDQALKNDASPSNIERLRIWCSIGPDVTNGAWAIYGARLGLYYLYIQKYDLSIIQDYDWFDYYWKTTVAPEFSVKLIHNENTSYHFNEDKLALKSNFLVSNINQNLDIDICDFTSSQSRFFKSVYRNSHREGPML